MNAKVQSVLNTILDQFKNSEQIPQAIALITYPTANLPMYKWSLLNQLICYFTGMTDFRGYRQWEEVKRHVMKGEKGTHILVPWIKKDEEEKPTLAGFMTASVFGVEQTDGDPLEYQQLELPPFPLIERAKELGVDITAIPGSYEHYGYYSPTKKVIALASPEECVFFHEVSHLAQHRLFGELKKGQDPLQEISAELSALTIGYILGKDGRKYIGNSYRYIEKYSKKLDTTPYGAVLKVLSRTEKILNFLLKEEKDAVLQAS